MVASRPPTSDAAPMLRTLLQAGGDDVVGTVFECSLGAVPARVVVLGQQVITATVGSSAGLDALVRTLLVEPQVQQRPASPSLVASLSALPALGPIGHVLATVDAQLEQLRTEAEALGGLQGRLAVRLVLLGNHKASLPDDVQRLARLADGTRDVATLIVEAPIAPPLTLRALLKLFELGIVARVDEGRAGVAVDRHWQRVSRAPTDSTPTTASSSPAPGASSSSPSSPSLPASPLGASSLPASVPHPRAQRSLADDDAFFAEHAPPSSLPMVLAVVAALIVVVVVVALLVR